VLLIDRLQTRFRFDRVKEGENGQTVAELWGVILWALQHCQIVAELWGVILWALQHCQIVAELWGVILWSLQHCQIASESWDVLLSMNTALPNYSRLVRCHTTTTTLPNCGTPAVCHTVLTALPTQTFFPSIKISTLRQFTRNL
jgi:hypothetical protein